MGYQLHTINIKGTTYIPYRTYVTEIEKWILIKAIAEKADELEAKGIHVKKAKITKEVK